MLAYYLSAMKTKAEKDLYESLYIEHRDKLANYAYRILKDKQLSEDAVEEAFCILGYNMKKISDKTYTEMRNYIIIIVRNICYKMYKKQKRECPMGYVEANDKYIGEPYIYAENNILLERIFEIIKGLDPKYGDVLILKYYYNNTNREIAHALGISLGNVKVRLSRGNEMIKKIIAEEKLH